MKAAARAIILSDDSLLVMHRNKFGHEYEVLIGGGVEMGETPEQAVVREIQEETGVSVSPLKLVFLEQAEEPYGLQYVYLCRYIGGEAKLNPGSTEFQINQAGKNLYQPRWIPLNSIASTNFRSDALKQALIVSLKDGFPNEPIDITDWRTV